ncbi:hypothetical protein [Natronococcus wangiae]|uniref:hypothetical protein n=1 Tax=Natronococcus wangiae TaxID=3068275 RepID=UPI00273F93D2|nr:hypothetical protein [Natronococcus sp. AD5]
MGDLEPTEIVDEIADRFSSYVGRGVALNMFNAEPETNIQNLFELLELYFVLTGRVLDDVKTRSAVDEPIENVPNSWNVGILDFVSLLPHRVAGLETTTRKKTVQYEGEVRGQIDWQETIKQRSRSPGSGGQLFVCRERREVVLTDENEVLLTLLANVERIVTHFIEEQGEDLPDFEWFSPWFDDTKSRRILTQVLDRNPYLSDLEVSPEAVSARKLRAGSRSRNPLYREAAELLETLQRLQSGELTETEAEQILSTTFFVPDDEDDDTLYELYWAIELLDAFEDQNPTYRQLTQSTDLVAEWKTEDARYQLFHDWSGTYRGRQLLSFDRKVDDVETHVRFDEPPKYLARTKEALQTWGRLAPEVTDSESLQFKTGRPDLALLRYDRSSSTLMDVFLGEVKFSSDIQLVKRGLRELLEYATYAKVGQDLDHEIHDVDTEYLLPGADPFESLHVSLGLFTEDPSLKATNPEDGLAVYQFQDNILSPFSQK